MQIIARIGIAAGVGRAITIITNFMTNIMTGTKGYRLVRSLDFTLLSYQNTASILARKSRSPLRPLTDDKR
jgi:hypothetical protein